MNTRILIIKKLILLMTTLLSLYQIQTKFGAITPTISAIERPDLSNETSIVYEYGNKKYLKAYGYPVNTKINGQWERTKEGFIDFGSFFQNRSQRFNGQVSKQANQGDTLFVGTSSVSTTLDFAVASAPALLDDNTADIDGNPIKNKVLFTDVWPNIDVRYTAIWKGNKRDIIIKNANAQKSITLHYCSPTLDPIVPVSENDPISFENVINVIPTIAYDANSKNVPLTVTNIKSGKCIDSKISYNPTGFIYPITIDPNTNPTASAGDGVVNISSGASWSAARDATNGSAAASTNVKEFVQDDKEGATWFVYRMFFPYNTSVIGATDTVNDASTTITTDANGAGTRYGTVTLAATASDVALSTSNGDFSSGNFTARSAETSFANSTLYRIQLTGNLSDDSLIKRATNTYLKIIGSCDLNNVDPAIGGGNCATGNHYQDIDLSENATPANRPVLNITYTVAGANPLIKDDTWFEILWNTLVPNAYAF